MVRRYSAERTLHAGLAGGAICVDLPRTSPFGPSRRTKSRHPTFFPGVTSRGLPDHLVEYCQSFLRGSVCAMGHPRRGFQERQGGPACSDHIPGDTMTRSTRPSAMRTRPKATPTWPSSLDCRYANVFCDSVVTVATVAGAYQSAHNLSAWRR